MSPKKNRAAAKDPVILSGSSNPSSVAFNVLGYRDEGGWVALALEMDLRGYGSTFEEAQKDLTYLVAMQIGFARSKGQPGLT
jgi:hypothetical protein